MTQNEKRTRGAGLLPALAREDGSAVLMVLLLLAIFIGLGFAYRQMMSLEGRLAAMQMERRQGMEYARAGLQVALSLLRTDDPNYDALNDAWAASPQLEGALGDGWTWSLRPSAELPDNGIYDVESRLGLNALPEPVLARLPGLPAQGLLDLMQARRSAPVPSVDRFVSLSRLDARSFERAAGAGPARLFSVHGTAAALNANTAGAFALGVVLGDEELAQRLVARRRGADGVDGTADDRPWRSVEELRAELTRAGPSGTPTPGATAVAGGASAPGVPGTVATATPQPAGTAPGTPGVPAATATALPSPGPAAGGSTQQPGSEVLTVRSRLYSITATGELRSGSIFVRRRLRALVERTEAGVRVITCSEL